MAKRDLLAEAVSRLAALRAVEDPRQLHDGVTAALRDNHCYLVARAATLAAEKNLRALVPVIVARLTDLLGKRESDDIGCAAALAMVQALVTLQAGTEAEDVASRAAGLVRWESGYGGSTDSAVSVRGNAVILLAAMGSSSATRHATELLAEPDFKAPTERTSWAARVDAARALTMIGSAASAAVLRFKILIGDDEPNVLSDCLAGLLSIERDVALPLAEAMLDGDRSDRAEAALLAVGGWRDARAFGLLHARADGFLSSGSRDVYLAAVAMTRQPAAVDYLLDLVSTGSRALSSAAAAALEPLRLLPGVADRLAAALKTRSNA